MINISNFIKLLLFILLFNQALSAKKIKLLLRLVKVSSISYCIIANRLTKMPVPALVFHGALID